MPATKTCCQTPSVCPNLLQTTSSGRECEGWQAAAEKRVSQGGCLHVANLCADSLDNNVTDPQCAAKRGEEPNHPEHGRSVPLRGQGRTALGKCIKNNPPSHAASRLGLVNPYLRSPACQFLVPFPKSLQGLYFTGAMPSFQIHL